MEKQRVISARWPADAQWIADGPWATGDSGQLTHVEQQAYAEQRAYVTQSVHWATNEFLGTCVVQSAKTTLLSLHSIHHLQEKHPSVLRRHHSSLARALSFLICGDIIRPRSRGAILACRNTLRPSLAGHHYGQRWFTAEELWTHKKYPKKVNFISVLISRSHNDLRSDKKTPANKKHKKIENIFAGDYFLTYICTRKTKGTVA